MRGIAQPELVGRPVSPILSPARVGILVSIGVACLGAQTRQALVLTNRLPLAGVEGRIDHLSVDTVGNRLFISALGNHTLEVLEIASAKRLRSTRNLAEPQGVYYDSSSNRIFVASAGDGTTRIFDGNTYAPIATVSFSANADNVRYDARTRGVIVGHGSGALAFIDAAGKRTREITLGAHPEFIPG